MYYGFREEAELIVLKMVDVRIRLYPRGWINLDSLRFGTRYSATGIATRSCVILYSTIRRLSMRL